MVDAQEWLDKNYPKEIRSQISNLDLSNKNLEGTLDLLSGFSNLEKLNLNGNCFYGSLKPLQNIGKLQELDIRNTNIDSGLEYLPDSVKHFSCLESSSISKGRAWGK